jgi:hypothetical protein
MDQSKSRPPRDAYVPSQAPLPSGADPEAVEQQRYVSIFLYPELWKLAPDQNLWDDRIDLLNNEKYEYEKMGTD